MDATVNGDSGGAAGGPGDRVEGGLPADGEPRLPVSFAQRIVGDVSVCYSGGLDSTTVAFVAARQGGVRVHLHTLRHGYGYLFYRWVERTLETLKRSLGEDRVLHRYVRTKDLFDAVAMHSLCADRRTYGAGFGCCLGCTLAVVTKIIVYNLENRVPHIMFGSSVGGQYAVMSMPETIERLKAFCAAYGIRYSTPLLDNGIRKDRERALLDRYGVFRGRRFLDKHSFGNQGYCLLSVQHLPDVLFNAHPVYDARAVAQFMRDRQPLCERYIADCFARTGRDLEAARGALFRMGAVAEGSGA